MWGLWQAGLLFGEQLDQGSSQRVEVHELDPCHGFWFGAGVLDLSAQLDSQHSTVTELKVEDDTVGCSRSCSVEFEARATG